MCWGEILNFLRRGKIINGEVGRKLFNGETEILGFLINIFGLFNVTKLYYSARKNHNYVSKESGLGVENVFSVLVSFEKTMSFERT